MRERAETEKELDQRRSRSEGFLRVSFFALIAFGAFAFRGVSVCMYVCMFECVCMYVCMFVCMYVCMCV